MATPMFAVSEQKNRWLQLRMLELGVTESDFDEQFIHSSGPGGQHVNKSATAVQLRHHATGLVVTADRERSQSINRFLARRALLEQLAVLTGNAPKRANEQERKRKQKQRRSRRARAARPDTETHDS